MKAKCPKCGWLTRELSDDEIEMVEQGRMRCSGDCQAASSPGVPSTFPPKIHLEKEDASNGRRGREHRGGRDN
jgi:hypothetical protein